VVDDVDLRMAGIGGLSAAIGWTEVQQQEGKASPMETIIKVNLCYVFCRILTVLYCIKREKRVGERVQQQEGKASPMETIIKVRNMLRLFYQSSYDFIIYRGRAPLLFHPIISCCADSNF
jgi:hypothetical protein